MGRTRKERSIRLRLLVVYKENKFQSICLDTNIANRADSFDQLKQKIFDSTSLYLNSFSEDELLNKAYVRKAPLKYELIWHFKLLQHFFSREYERKEANYNPHSGKLRFA
jgi:hypothetical protein